MPLAIGRGVMAGRTMCNLHSRQVLAAGAALALSLVGAPAAAQTPSDPAPAITATALGPLDRLVLDGRLDEDVWSRATRATGFRQQDPLNGEPSTESTVVAVVFDPRRIVIGVRCYDSNPDGVLGNQMQRDQVLSADDRFMIAIDPYANGRTGYYFEVNPAGAMGDGLVLQGTGLSVNRSWDGIWNARVARDDQGWSAEIEIPLHSLNFDPRASDWGINFQRTIRRKNEEALWTGWPRNQGLTAMATAGRLEGLHDLSQGLGLDVLPYAVASVSTAPGRGRADASRRAAGGADLVYSLTPGLRANVSINTDFAETDVDTRQVNLTRFSLFFPERRAFFLEGASVFDFAREPGSAIVPFFSRRIGLNADGVPQPVDYGVKLTGQAGAFDVGVLRVRTRDDAAQRGEAFSVARARARFWRQSYVGAIVTDRGEGDVVPRRTVGADALLSTNQFLGRQALELSGFVLHTTPRAGTRGGRAAGVRLAFPNDPINARISLREVQDGYDPAVGFVDRRAYRLVQPALRYIVRPRPNRVVRRFSFEADVNLTFDLDNRLETRRSDLQFVRMDLESGDIVEFHLLPLYERLPVPFRIATEVTLPAGGEYRFLRRRVQWQSAPQRLWSLSGQHETGEFYSGSRRQITGTLALRPRRGWLLSLTVDDNRVVLAEGRFTTRVWSGDASTQFSPFLALVNRIQYDTVSRQLGWQSRLRWITTPGNDFFLVYTRNWVDGGSLRTLDSRGAVKVVRTLRF